MITRNACFLLLLSTALAYEISLTALDIPLKPCPPAPGQGLANCFANETCCGGGYFGASGCEVMLPDGKSVCCAPGPAFNVSTTMPNCLVIGDSVSDQYTPSVAKLLNTTCLVQHAPWVRTPMNALPTTYTIPAKSKLRAFTPLSFYRLVEAVLVMPQAGSSIS